MIDSIIIIWLYICPKYTSLTKIISGLSLLEQPVMQGHHHSLDMCILKQISSCLHCLHRHWDKPADKGANIHTTAFVMSFFFSLPVILYPINYRDLVWSNNILMNVIKERRAD